MRLSGTVWVFLLAFSRCDFTSVKSQRGRSNSSGWEGTEKIVGGHKVSITEVPYQVSLRNSAGAHFCGGTILNSYYVLTAAHCVVGTSKKFYVVAGVSQVNAGELIPVTLAIAHKYYDNETMENDIAVLKVRWSLNLDGDKQRSLPLATSVVEDGTVCTISGWGSTLFSPMHARASMSLRKAQVPIYNQELCGIDLGDEDLPPGQICAGFEDGGQDTCQGDSGGPLECDGLLVGIVSWGLGCGEPHQPGVYTSVPHYRTWILRQISSSCTTGAYHLLVFTIMGLVHGGSNLMTSVSNF